MYDYIDSPFTYLHEWLDNANPLHDFVTTKFWYFRCTSEDIELAYYVLSDALQTCIDIEKLLKNLIRLTPTFVFLIYSHNIVVTQDHPIKIIDLDAFRNGTNYKNTGCAMDDRLITINTIIYWQNTIAFSERLHNNAQVHRDGDS